MNKSIVLALVVLPWAAYLPAQLEDANAGTQAECAKYLKTPMPPEALQVSQPKTWPDCNSYKLYSGIRSKVDYPAARECAWSERLAIQKGIEPRYSEASVFGGAAMLTVLYANGDGVGENLPLALRFACEAGGAPAEISIRVQHLQSLEAKTRAVGTKFTFCDDITSGFMEGFCAAYASELMDQRRSMALDEIKARMSPIQRVAFAHLVREEEAYARAHAAGEIDLSGTARAMFQIDAEETLREDFIAALQSFEAGKYPGQSSQTYSDADARLTSVYRKVMGAVEEHMKDYGAVQPKGVRDAERAWLKYREAWTEFVRLRYPVVAPDDLLVLLTNDRTSVLDGTFCDMDVVDGPCAKKGDTWKPSPLP